MELFTVSLMTSSPPVVEKLYNEMLQELRALHTYDKGIRLDCKVNSKRAEFTCSVALPGFQLRKDAKQIYAKIGLAIAEYVISELENKFIRDLITKEYKYQANEDIASIEKYCSQLLSEPEQLASRFDERQRRKAKMGVELQKFLEDHTLLVIDGFVRFRLQHYMDELREVVEYAIDEFLMDRQYQEFISLLKYFVYIQESKIPEAHLMHKGENDFLMLNEQLKPIEARQIDHFAMEFLEKDVNLEDMVISTLISVSPEKIVIHSRQPDMQVIKTIQQIFENRTQLCTYCHKCQPVLGEKRIDLLST